MLRDCVLAGKSVAEISVILGKHRTSVCRELWRNRQPVGAPAAGDACPRLARPPYVCNCCEDAKHLCPFQKWYYIPDSAQKKYEMLLTSSRDGFNLSEAELARLGTIVGAGVNKGQSLHHIAAAHKDEIGVSVRTLYRLVNARMLPVRRYQLPNATKRKPRASKLKERRGGSARRIDRECRTGRTYEDFTAFMAGQRHHVDLVEMDSVVGPRGSSKVLLTLNLNSCGLMLAFIRDANTSQSVIDVFNRLEETLGTTLFSRLFPVILTDNGTEFSNPGRLENSPHGGLRTRIFYCHPYSSSEKPHVENNHENLRRVIEKGRSFDNLTQEDVNVVVCHVNSMLRKEYGNRTAISRFVERYGETAACLLGLMPVPADSVCLKPKLLDGKL